MEYKKKYHPTEILNIDGYNWNVLNDSNIDHIKYIEIGGWCLPGNVDPTTDSNVEKVISKFPKSLEVLIFLGYYNRKLPVLPKTLKIIKFSLNYNFEFEMPPKLEILQLGYHYNQPLSILPNSLKELKIGHNYTYKLDVSRLDRLSKLIFNTENIIIDYIPPKIKYLETYASVCGIYMKCIMKNYRIRQMGFMHWNRDNSLIFNIAAEHCQKNRNNIGLKKSGLIDFICDI